MWARLPKPAIALDACGRALRRTLPALVTTGSVAIVGSSLFLGYRWVTKSHRFAITAIEVRGTERLAPDDVLAAAPAQLGANIFTTSVTEVERAVADHPWIESVEVRRELPHTLVIEVREHHAAGIARMDTGESYLVDADGAPFKRVDAATGEASGLPVVTGLPRAAFTRDPAATAVAITVALAALSTWTADASRPAVAEVQLDATGGVTLHIERGTGTGAEIELGHLPQSGTQQAIAVALATRLHAFDATWAELATDERLRVRTIHLDCGGTPTVSAAERRRGSIAGGVSPAVEQVTVAFTPAS